MKTIISLLTIFLAQNCNQKIPKMESQEKLPALIEYVFFQKWVGGLQEAGSGINFEIKFKSSFPKNYKLSKVYFEKKVADFGESKDNFYMAYFFSKPNSENMILDNDSEKEYGNKIPEDLNVKFDLKPNEAILEFTNGQKIEHYKLTKIKEKEFLAYPSAPPSGNY